MKLATAPFLARFRYDPEPPTDAPSPLFDRKSDRYLSPTATVRMHKQYFTPKQVVYIITHPDSVPTPDNPDPAITLPRYLLNIDNDPTNIKAENLKPSKVSRRWADNYSKNYIEAPEGFLVPRHMLSVMTEDDLNRLGIDESML